MSWYAAHIIIAFKTIKRTPKKILIHENIYLIEASDGKEAQTKAEKIGREEADLEDAFTIDDLPAKSHFAGIRKIIKISNPAPYDIHQYRKRPVDGTEITYSVLEIPDEKALKRLASGKPVQIAYRE